MTPYIHVKACVYECWSSVFGGLVTLAGRLHEPYIYSFGINIGLFLQGLKAGERSCLDSWWSGGRVWIHACLDSWWLGGHAWLRGQNTGILSQRSTPLVKSLNLRPHCKLNGLLNQSGLSHAVTCLWQDIMRARRNEVSAWNLTISSQYTLEQWLQYTIKRSTSRYPV